MSAGKPRTAKQERHHDRACAFYKMVLRWQRERQGGHGRSSRQAVMGLPEAVRGNSTHAHVKRFIEAALADGTPWDDLHMLVAELEKRARVR
jgi:hypothetical protein